MKIIRFNFTEKIVITLVSFLFLGACSSSVDTKESSTIAEVSIVADDITKKENETVIDTIPFKNKVVFEVFNYGGCMRMGPNCPAYKLYVDGSFNLYRMGTEGYALPEIVSSGMIDKAMLADWLALVDGIDFLELVKDLEKGECRSCFDGIDKTYSIHMLGVEMGVQQMQLSSRSLGFDMTLPFFQQGKKLEDEMYRIAPLEIKMREQ